MEKEEKKSALIWILTAVIIMLLIGVTFLLFFLLKKKDDETIASADKKQVYGYESSVITDDPETLQQKVNEMYAKAAEGQMGLEFKNEAFSEDGSTFSCYLANSDANSYDMLMIIYIDDTQEEIARTGLIPIGARREEFTTTKTLEKGDYEATIVFNLVEDDHETIHSHVNVAYTLHVK